jgi:hypothetical protein
LVSKCKVRYDYYYQQWVVEDDNGNLTDYDSKQQLEDYLDWQENFYSQTASGNNEGPQNEAE